MPTPLRPEADMLIRSLVSAGVADVRTQLLSSFEDLLQSFAESTESQFIDLHDRLLQEQLRWTAGARAKSQAADEALITSLQGPPLSKQQEFLVPASSALKPESQKSYSSGLRAVSSDTMPTDALPVSQAVCEKETVSLPSQRVSWLPQSQTDHPNKLQSIVNTKQFETFFSFIILLNCAGMGLEVHQDVRNDLGSGAVAILEISEHLFTIVFTIELFLRAVANGVSSFVPQSDGRNLWNFMDAMLVIFTGIIFTWLIPLLSQTMGFNSPSGIVRIFTVMRAARLIRLVRVFQRVPIFREAWLLIRGLSDSVRTLFWTCVVIAFVTYVFAIFGLVLLVNNLQDTYDIAVDAADKMELGEVLDILAGMDRLMFTLVQVLTMDSFHAIVRITVKYVWWSWIYFYFYVGISCFVLMNLVTAIIVDNAVSKSRDDVDCAARFKENKRAEELQELQQLFFLMDADSSGTISWTEFKGSFEDSALMKKWVLLDFLPGECRELFDLLDDGDGEIDSEEFFEGLSRMKGPAAAKDIFRLQKTVERLGSNMASFGSGMASARSDAARCRPAGEKAVAKQASAAEDAVPLSPRRVPSGLPVAQWV